MSIDRAAHLGREFAKLVEVGTDRRVLDEVDRLAGVRDEIVEALGPVFERQVLVAPVRDGEARARRVGIDAELSLREPPILRCNCNR